MFFKFCDACAWLINKLIMVLGVVLLCSVALQVAGRYVPYVPPWLWPLEVTNFALIWAIFLGSIIAVRDNKHFVVDVFGMGGKPIHPVLNLFLRVLYYIVLAVMTYVFIRYGWEYFWKWGRIQESETTGVNMGWLYVSVPVAGVFWFLFMIEGIIKEVFCRSKTCERS